jgi:hypothetical protein
MSQPSPLPQEPSADLRVATHDMPFAANPDLVVRLRTMDSRTPFAKGIVLEAAAEIERLREAIRRHRSQVWGADEPDHASDAQLYDALE